MKTSRLTWRSWRNILGRLILVMAPIPLLWWTFQQVPLRKIWETLGSLNWFQIGIWLVINAGIVVFMTSRWWLVGRVLGYPLPYLTLTRYRLAAFAVSYFTPGPQFGGEPLQVFVLHRRHNIPAASATASVSLDKLLELIANFSFLVFGIGIAMAGAWLPEHWRSTGLLLAVGLLALPLAYLVLMLSGRKPLYWMTDRLTPRMTQNKFIRTIRLVETEMSQFCIRYPRTVLIASLISLGVWLCMVFEYSLVIRFLGFELTLPQVITAMVAARLAFLTPLPGGLGALEASQMVAFQTLGLPPTYGISIALLVRLRDFLFGLVGLLIVISLLGWQRTKRFWKINNV